VENNTRLLKKESISEFVGLFEGFDHFHPEHTTPYIAHKPITAVATVK
jgi:hypothetical protein